MTNDVERIILDDVLQNELNYAENKAYMLYKEIWKFLLYIKNEEFNLIRISFCYDIDNNFGYIKKNEGITYTKFKEKSFSQYHNYYEGCSMHYINLLFNTNIDMKLFFKLITMDNFYYNYSDDCAQVRVYIDVKKDQIERKINETLLKNKILKKEK